MAALMAIAQRYGLKVVEDCAQATGASRVARVEAGVGCWLLYQNRWRRRWWRRDWSRSSAGQTMRELAAWHAPATCTELGYNSRLDALQAAVLNVNCPISPPGSRNAAPLPAATRSARRAPWHSTIPLRLQARAMDGTSSWCASSSAPRTASCAGSCTDSPSNFGLPSSRCRDWLKQSLQEHGVSTIIYYPIPIHRQPAYAELATAPNSLPITERLCSEVLSLPIFPELSEGQQDQVIMSCGSWSRMTLSLEWWRKGLKPSLLFFVIHQRLRAHAALGCNLATEQILGVHMPQLRHPAADVIAFGIKFTPGWRDRRRGGLTIPLRALPAAVIGRQIAIHPQLHECTLTPAPVATGPTR